MNVPVPLQPQALPQPVPAGPVPMPAPPFVWNAMASERKLELLEYWRSITRRKWAILGLALAVAILAAVISMSMTPIYRASATVLIEAGKQKIVSVEDVYGRNEQREHYQTQVELLKSREVAVRTIAALKLWNHPEYDPRKVQPGYGQRLLAALGMADKSSADQAWTEERLTTAPIKELQENLRVTPVRLSQLVKVEVESTDKALAATIANTLVQQYIEADREERFRMTTEVSQQLQDRLVSLRDNLTKSEQALQSYRESKGLVNLGGSTQANSAQQLGGMTERLLQARTRRIELEGSYLQAKNASPATWGSIPAVVRDMGVNEAQRLVSAAAGKLAEMQQRLGPAHDQLKQAQAELAEATAQLQARQRAIVTSIMRDYEAAQSAEASIERSMASARDSAQGVNREEFKLAVLEREYQSNRQLYEMFMSRAKETNLIGGVQPAVARIADMAVAPDTAVKPNRTNIVLVAGALALLLGSLAAVTIDRMDNTVKGGDDAEARLQTPVLATLPQVEAANRKLMARAFLTNSHSHFSEGIRTARTGVALSGLDSPNKILLVTSCVPGEGKTTVAVNLAFAHAHTGTRTLLIDCDMRRAQASRSVGLGGASRGMTSLVAGASTLADSIRPIRDTGLDVLPVGDTPPNPLEMLMSQKFKDLLAQLSQEYPMIVIDSPPVELVSEALVLAPMATNIAVVVKAMSTPAPLVRKTQQRLQRAGGKVLGVIINGLNFKDAKRYYGEYAHSSYSYGYDGQHPYAVQVKSPGADAGTVDVEVDVEDGPPKARNSGIMAFLKKAGWRKSRSQDVDSDLPKAA